MPLVTPVPVTTSPGANAPALMLSMVSVKPAIVPMAVVGWTMPLNDAPVAVVAGPSGPRHHAGAPDAEHPVYCIVSHHSCAMPGRAKHAGGGGVDGPQKFAKPHW